MAMARRKPDAATARGHCAVAGRPAWGALQHGGEGAEGTAEGIMGEIVPDADGSCKITEARSPTDPEHEEQEENHSRAHRDRTAGHASQTEDLRSSPSEKTPRGQAEQGRATAGVSAEKSQTTAKRHLDFYTPRKHSNTEAITSFSGKKKKKAIQFIKGKNSQHLRKHDLCFERFFLFCDDFCTDGPGLGERGARVWSTCSH